MFKYNTLLNYKLIMCNYQSNTLKLSNVKYVMEKSNGLYK